MSLLQAQWTQLVELQVPATASQQVNFGDQPQLRTQVDQVIIIKGIELIPSTSLAVGPSGLTNAPLAELQKSMLVINNDDQQKIYQYPVLNLNRVFGDPANFIPNVWDLQLFKDLYKVAWTKSYVEFTQAPANLPYCILFNVYYDKLTGDAIKTI